jgi:hypothetical protein
MPFIVLLTDADAAGRHPCISLLANKAVAANALFVLLDMPFSSKCTLHEDNCL